MSPSADDQQVWTGGGIVTTSAADLSYVEVGTTGPSLLLLHGMACHSGQMTTIAGLLGVDHRCVAVDLRGHGRSSIPDDGYRMEAFVDDVDGIVQSLRLEQPVVIGHSFGGTVAVAYALARPHATGAVVQLDSGLRTPAEVEQELGGIYDELDDVSDDQHGIRLTDFMRRYLFIDDDDPAEVERILADMARLPRHVFTAMGAVVRRRATAAAAAQCPVPGLAIQSAVPFASAEALDALGARWRVGRVVGSGHFIHVFAPEQTAAMIRRFVGLVAGSLAR